ncbi:MAG: FkbM family methyltransferase [Hydrococcus sp. C42_A2020_068]|nr:FkbM family methyltransferase [Hydrococcus sp. C42_A2020_068]
MRLTDSRSWLKQLLGYLLRLLPLSWIEWLCQLESSPNIRRIARLGLRNRDVTLGNGVGKGLKFNAAEANPDSALGIYELPMQQVLASHLKPGDTFYDIGANVGFFTVLAAKLVGLSGRVYAFEPVPENADIIRHNVKLNNFSNVIILEKAVSDSTGKGKLLLAEHPGGHTLSTGGMPPDLKGSTTVELVSIDDLVAQKTITPPSVIKIDVEGAELDVLRGMFRTLEEFKPILIYEVDDGDRKAFMRKSQEIETFVRSRGYTISHLEEAYSNLGWYVGHAIATPARTESISR